MIRKILFAIAFTTVFDSCETKELKETRIDFISAEKLSDVSTAAAPLWLQDILKPLEDTSKIAFVPKIFAKRLDIDSTQYTEIIVDEAFTTSTKKRFGTLTLEDIKIDQEESLAKLKAGLLGEKSKKAIDFQSYLNNAPEDLLYLTLDSAKRIGKANEFFTTASLRSFLVKELQSGKRNTAKILVSRGITTTLTGTTKEMLDSVKVMLKEGDYQGASLVCEQLARSSANRNEFKPFADELVKMADNQFVSVQKLGKVGCDYIPASMAYISCSASLYSDGTSSNIERYNSYKKFASVNCGLITLPSPPSK